MHRPRRLILPIILAIVYLSLTVSASGVGFNFDTTPPTIGTPSVQSNSQSSGTLTVAVSVQDPDSPIKNVSIFYTTDHWSSVNKTVVMSYDNNTKIATGVLPSPSIGLKLEYYIIAFDPSGNRAINNNRGNYYSYTASQPSTIATWMLAATTGAIGAALVLTIFLSRKRKANPPTQGQSTQDVNL